MIRSFNTINDTVLLTINIRQNYHQTLELPKKQCHKRKETKHR